MSPVSFSTINPGNFDLGPCQVTYGGVDLGATLKNVVLKVEETVADLKSDQLGTTVIDKRVSGMKITVETELAEILLKANWKVVFPMNKLVTDNSGNTLMYFDSQISASLRSFAKLLVLHPLDHATTDKSGDVNIYLATPDPKSEYHFSPTEQASLKVTWEMYPDFTTTPARFMAYGDLAVGLVNASAGAAVAGTGNTGNGTVSAITVFNAFTKTEIISMQAVVAGTGGEFYVSGSLSGPLGLAHNGVTFNSSEISFLINNGATPFAINDTFTIATTAANYQ